MSPEPHASACAVPRTQLSLHAPIGMIKLELVLERFRLLCSDCILTPRRLKPAAQGSWEPDGYYINAT